MESIAIEFSSVERTYFELRKKFELFSSKLKTFNDTKRSSLYLHLSLPHQS